MLPSEEYIKKNEKGYLKSQNRKIRKAPLALKTKSPVKLYLTRLQIKTLEMYSNKLHLSKSAFVGYMLETFSQRPEKFNSTKYVTDKVIELFNNLQGGSNEIRS